MTLMYNDRDLFMKINLSYQIVNLQFGHLDQNYNTDMVRQTLQKMDLSEKLFENFVDHQPHIHENFIGGFWMELIPYTFIDNTNGFTFKSLQHSFNRRIKVR